VLLLESHGIVLGPDTHTAGGGCCVTERVTGVYSISHRPIRFRYFIVKCLSGGILRSNLLDLACP
jgi:hypothetical protein